MGVRESNQVPVRAAFTLVELVLSLAIMSVVMLGLASALLVAGHALPDRDSAVALTMEHALVGQQLAEELACATWFITSTSTSVEFTVADRDGDHVPERIRYEWSGVVGDPLLRSYNGASPIKVLTAVGAFDLKYESRSTTEQYVGPVVDGAETQLANYTVGLLPASYSINSSNFLGQYVSPSLANGALGWKPTRVTLSVRISGGQTDGQTRVRVCGADANMLPTSTVYAQTLVAESAFNGSFNWTDVIFTNSQMVPKGSGAAVTMIYSAGTGNIIDVQHFTSLFSGRLTSSNGGVSWTHGALQGVRCALYGKVCTQSADQTAARAFNSRVRFGLSGVNGGPVYCSSAALNLPERLARRWEAGFSVSPTLDLNGDGTADWGVTSGATLPPGDFGGDTWKMKEELYSQPGSDFDRLTTIEAGLLSTVVGAEAGLLINADRSNTIAATISLGLVLGSDGTQTLTLRHQVDATTRVVLKSVAGLGGGVVNVRLLIDPSLDTVNLRVNGVEQGTYVYSRLSNYDARRCVVLPASAGGEIDYIRIRVSE